MSAIDDQVKKLDELQRRAGHVLQRMPITHPLRRHVEAASRFGWTSIDAPLAAVLDEIERGLDDD